MTPVFDLPVNPFDNPPYNDPSYDDLECPLLTHSLPDLSFHSLHQWLNPREGELVVDEKTGEEVFTQDGF